MEKTYCWRIIVLLYGVCALVLGWVYDTYFCFATVDMFGCPLDKIRLTVLEPLFLLSLSLLAVSPFLFFIRDEVFLKWLRFTLVWFALAAIFVSLAPVYWGGWMSFGPTKESVSIWMSTLFVVISLGIIVSGEWKARKSK